MLIVILIDVRILVGTAKVVHIHCVSARALKAQFAIQSDMRKISLK